MRYTTVRLIKLILAFAAAGTVTTCLAAESCVPNLPRSAEELLNYAYPGFRILKYSDLNGYDQSLWRNAYQNACPGVVQGAFTRKQAEYAVLLVPVKQDGREARVVLLKPKKGGGVTQRQIFVERIEGNFPVIRRGEPGPYEDVAGKTRLKAPHDVVLLEHLESRVTAIAFLGVGIKTLTIAD